MRITVTVQCNAVPFGERQEHKRTIDLTDTEIHDKNVKQAHRRGRGGSRLIVANAIKV